MAQRHVAVVGGGVMGSFAAYWLKVLGGNGVRVTLVERDQLFCTTSAVLSAGGFRQQFSLKENISLSLASVDFFKNKLHTLNVDPDDEPPSIGLAENGYVFMAGTEEGKQTLQRNNELQRSLGADIKLLTAEEMKQTMPYLEVDDIKLGARGTQNEGYFDPYLLLQLVRRKVQSQGTTCISADTIGINMSSDKKTVESLSVIGNDGEQEIRCDAVVNAAGAWSGRLAKMAGIDLPVEPRPRTIYAVDCKEMGQYFQGSKHCPLTVDPSGVYFRGDVGSPTRFLCGKSPLAEEDTELVGRCVNEIRAQLDSYPCQNYFETNIWPVLAARAPHFETLKVQSSWSGCYDYNTWDQNGIVGPHPEVSNMFFCTGFSGHGLQMSPASGRAVAETVLEGKFVEVDLEKFKYDRFLEGEKVLERNIV